MSPALFLAALIWVAGLRLLPVTIRVGGLHAHAVNAPGMILLRRGLPVPGAVWAQEFSEARTAWRWLPVHVPAILIGRLRPQWAGWERRIEIMGHEVEVWAEVMLTGAAPWAVRRREARALSGYRCFEGWSSGAIMHRMEAVSTPATAFVSRHQSRIRAMDARG